MLLLHHAIAIARLSIVITLLLHHAFAIAIAGLSVAITPSRSHPLSIAITIAPFHILMVIAIAIVVSPLPSQSPISPSRSYHLSVIFLNKLYEVQKKRFILPGEEQLLNSSITFFLCPFQVVSRLENLTDKLQLSESATHPIQIF